MKQQLKIKTLYLVQKNDKNDKMILYLLYVNRIHTEDYRRLVIVLIVQLILHFYLQILVLEDLNS